MKNSLLKCGHSKQHSLYCVEGHYDKRITEENVVEGIFVMYLFHRGSEEKYGDV
jgi:hypothetical protein